MLGPLKMEYQERQLRQLVQQNAYSAGFAAALMLAFGWYGFDWSTGNDLFSMAANVFLGTLRFGGVAMGAVALLSMSGQRNALAVDFVVSCLCGIGMAGGGLGMIIDGGGGINPILAGIFGVMFVSAGIRNGSLYNRLGKGIEPDHGGRQGGVTWDDHPRPPGADGDSLASRLKQQRSEEPQEQASFAPSQSQVPIVPDQERNKQPRHVEELSAAAPAPPPVPPPAPNEPPVQEHKPSEPPGSGFLASFGEDDDTPRGV